MFVEDCWDEIHQRSRGRWSNLGSMVNNNKHITILRMDDHLYYSDDFSHTWYLSICLHDNSNTHFEKKEFSLIMPLKEELRYRDMLIVVEGKLTRVEMDNIYLFVLEKYIRRW